MKYNDIEMKSNKDCIVHFGDLKMHYSNWLIKIYHYIMVQFYANRASRIAQNSAIEPDRRMESNSSTSFSPSNSRD